MHAGESGGFYGFSATMDVYDFSLASDQYSFALAQIFNPGDGAVTSMNSIQIGWEVSLYVTISPVQHDLRMYFICLPTICYRSTH
jgi:hypothetical protein